MIVCSFETSSEHSTSLGRVRYERCVCGRFRVLLGSEVLKEGPSEAFHTARSAPGIRQRTLTDQDTPKFGQAEETTRIWDNTQMT